MLTLIMLGKLEEARQILAANWRLNAPFHANNTGKSMKDEGRMMNGRNTRLPSSPGSNRNRTRPSSASSKPSSPARNFPWPATWPSRGTSPTSSSF